MVPATVVAPSGSLATARPRSRADNLALWRLGSASPAKVERVHTDVDHAIDDANGRRHRTRRTNDRFALGGHLEILRRWQAVNHDGRFEGDDGATIPQGAGHLVVQGQVSEGV